ncbi:MULTISPECIES: MarC family protein [Vibrio]|uniref:UPF0056 membrane protein n=1 Tax=Vibrio algicola TaxID=2662262 RepID=A0A5Q0TI49_9VIBR|nr:MULTISPECIES: MarC family protein [Vibrio]MBD1575927.1 hypothetical protein [Vibrio sp. S11_S32]
MKEFIQATLTILALVNPAICAQMFNECTSNLNKEQKFKEAFKTVVTIGIVLLLAAFGGTSLLHVFGISLQAFSCAGGGILVWIGAGMIKSAQSKNQDLEEHPSAGSVAPLILFAASPGTITGVITVAASHSSLGIPLTAMIGVGATLLVLALVFVLSIQSSGDNKEPTTARKMITSYMGVIVIAMGVQFILSGVKTFMF